MTTSLSPTTPETAADRLAALVDELLEAHCDTICLADDAPGDEAWAAHLDYLRALQRVGRRTLAELSDVPRVRRSPATPERAYRASTARSANS